MASNDNNDTHPNTGKGGKNNNASRNRSAAAAEEDDDTAAAEREPPPYDPRQFQNPHPDDRDGGGKGKACTNVGLVPAGSVSSMCTKTSYAGKLAPSVVWH